MTHSARIELRVARTEDVPHLRRIWRESFGDEEEYLDFFFERRFVPENTPILTVEGEPAAQLFLLPAALRTQNGLYSIDYLFSAATDPKYRKRGFMEKLLRFSRSLAKERGKAAIVLLPGSAALYRYYAKCGYETAFFRRTWRCTRETLQSLATPVPSADAVQVLTARMHTTDGVIWDEAALRYALDEHRAFRGEYAAAGCAFAAVSEEDAQILAPPEAIGQGCALLLRLSDTHTFTVTLPPDAPFGTIENGGMICFTGDALPLRDAFISFAME